MTSFPAQQRMQLIFDTGWTEWKQDFVSLSAPAAYTWPSESHTGSSIQIFNMSGPMVPSQIAHHSSFRPVPLQCCEGGIRCWLESAMHAVLHACCFTQQKHCLDKMQLSSQEQWLVAVDLPPAMPSFLHFHHNWLDKKMAWHKSVWALIWSMQFKKRTLNIESFSGKSWER